MVKNMHMMQTTGGLGVKNLWAWHMVSFSLVQGFLGFLGDFEVLVEQMLKSFGRNGELRCLSEEP